MQKKSINIDGRKYIPHDMDKQRSTGNIHGTKTEFSRDILHSTPKKEKMKESYCHFIHRSIYGNYAHPE